MSQHVGRLIYSARMQKEWTLADLAAVIGCSVPHVSMVERGLRRVPPARLRQFGQVLGIAEAVLYDRFVKDAVEVAREEWLHIDETVELSNTRIEYQLEEVITLDTN